MLPSQALLLRLRNDEKELRDLEPNIVLSSENFLSGERGTVMRIPTVKEGTEEVEVAFIYHVSGLEANGYVLRDDRVIPRKYHNFDIYILRSYPFPLGGISRKVYKAPLRIIHKSDIFHPNIEPGPEAGKKGRVCWNIFEKWLPTLSLSSIVTAYRELIENPLPADPLHIDICLRAASWFCGRCPFQEECRHLTRMEKMNKCVSRMQMAPKKRTIRILRAR